MEYSIGLTPCRATIKKKKKLAFSDNPNFVTNIKVVTKSIQVTFRHCKSVTNLINDEISKLVTIVMDSWT